jgi:hypothetical protein
MPISLQVAAALWQPQELNWGHTGWPPATGFNHEFLKPGAHVFKRLADPKKVLERISKNSAFLWQCFGLSRRI